MLLGGIRYLLPVIKAAHNNGYYVITADYLPDNIAHKYSDEYVNVSIIDKEAVLKVARDKCIDGIMSFGVDPGVVTAAYVAEQMGLPSPGPLESVQILQHKDRFRAFLCSNGFNVPWSFAYDSVQAAWEARSDFKYPLIVKPTDSAGSKGCTRVDYEKDLRGALETAFGQSICGMVIVEEFIEKDGFSSDTDCYSVDGQLVFSSFNSQWFDSDADNPYVPSAFSYPSAFSIETINYLTSEIQRLITLLGMKTAVYNVETRVGVDGKPYIMEFSPRGGGNRLCEMLRFATGEDLINAITQASVGDLPCDISQKECGGFWSEVVLHSKRAGTFRDLEIVEDPSFEVIERDLWISSGDVVKSFKGANDTIGTLILKFGDYDSMIQKLSCQSEWIKVIVE